MKNLSAIETGLPKVRVLLADDDEMVVRPLRRELTVAGFEVTYAADGAQALQALQDALAQGNAYDALVTDIQMPRLRGDVLQRLAREQDPTLAVMLITAFEDIELAVACMRDGVADYVTKPFQIEDVIVRLRSALEKRRLWLQVRDYQATLEARVEERTRELESQFLGAMESLSSALEAKDAYTNEHSIRVCGLAVSLAARLFPSDSVLQDQVKLAAQLHDIGKIGVPEAVINKPGVLDTEEARLIRQHPEIGNDILIPFIRDAGVLEIVRHHHERWDGSGYPDGLNGGNIPLGARILAVADAFDAMTSSRPYRDPMPSQCALDILRHGSGSQWDPEIIRSFLELLQEPQAAGKTAA